MKVHDRLDDDSINLLGKLISDIVNEDSNITHGEVLLACLQVICSVIASIQCRDCRELSARMVKEELPRRVKYTLKHLCVTPGGADTPHLH